MPAEEKAPEKKKSAEKKSAEKKTTEKKGTEKKSTEVGGESALRDTNVITDGGRLVKMEVDYFATCDEKIPAAQKMAKDGNVQEAVDMLMVLEKQTRTVSPQKIFAVLGGLYISFPLKGYFKTLFTSGQFPWTFYSIANSAIALSYSKWWHADLKADQWETIIFK